MARTETINASELREGCARLDGSFYCSEGARIRRLLVKCGVCTDTLDQVAESITNEGRGRRTYLTDHSCGVQLLSSSDILLADFGDAPYVSQRTPNLYKMLLEKGWTLVSCSGTIGKVAYAHADFEGRAASQHVMRVAPNARIRSGYLFVWLSSKAGVALLKRGSYGSVIPTIEPPTVLDLPVARLADPVEEAIHERVEAAAAKRVEANRKLEMADEAVRQLAGLPSQFSAPQDHAFVTGEVATGELGYNSYRLDAYHYIGYAGEVRHWESPLYPMLSLSRATARVFEPPIFKRIRAEDGVPYLLGAECYEAHPRPATKITRHTANLEEYLLRRDMVVVEDAGQRYGLLGTPAYVGRTLDGCAATNNMIRLVCRTREDAGYLFALLRSQLGIRAIRRLSYGTSLPHILPKQLQDLRVPWPEDDTKRQPVAQPVLEAVDLRDEANDLEDEAQAILERALDEATGGIWSKLTHAN